MTEVTSMNMLLNVSGLLRESMGSTRKYGIEDEIDVTGCGKAKPVTGTVRLTRTMRGILVQGNLKTQVDLTCSRCLEPFTSTVSVRFEEEYIPTIDVLTGAPLPPPEDSTEFTIDQRHVIDLEEAIRQYALLSVPMKPLCTEECAGLCKTCGCNLNKGACTCPPQAVDPRWAKLNRLLKK